MILLLLKTLAIRYLICDEAIHFLHNKGSKYTRYMYVPSQTSRLIGMSSVVVHIVIRMNLVKVGWIKNQLVYHAYWYDRRGRSSQTSNGTYHTNKICRLQYQVSWLISSQDTCGSKFLLIFAFFLTTTGAHKYCSTPCSAYGLLTLQPIENSTVLQIQ